MDMIEKVARATFHAECDPHKDETGYQSLWDWIDVAPSVRERHLTIAKAAIEAMREPTKVMIDAVEAAEVASGVVYAAYEHIEWDDAWTVAIDAALK